MITNAAISTEPRGCSLRLRALLDRWTPGPVGPLDAEIERRRQTVLAFWLIGALPWPLIFAFVYGFVLGCPAGALICIAALAAMLPIPAFVRSEAGVRFGAHWLIGAMVAALAALAGITGGSGAPALNWLLIVPLVANHLAGLRAGILWCAITLAVHLAFSALHDLAISIPQLLTHGAFDDLATLGNAGLILLIATLAGAYDAQRLAAVKLARERQANLKEALARAEEQAQQLAQSSEALRQSEALYRSLVQNSPMGMYFFALNAGDELILTGANPAADELTGLDAASRLGLPLTRAFPALEGTEVPSRYRAAASEGVTWSADRFHYADGTASGVFELRAFQTAPRKMVVVFSEISDRVRAEAAVRASEREIALQAGKAEVATHVLHNVGNVLSRVKVSATLVRECVTRSEAPTVGLVAGLLAENQHQLADFLQRDERGRSLPEFLRGLAELLAGEQAAILAELRGMSEAIEHIALVISMQQVHNRGGALVESVRPAEIVEQALSISVSARSSAAIELVHEFEEIGPLTLQRHKVLQILVNLLSNAVHAVGRAERPRITCRVGWVNGETKDVLRFSVADNGVGIGTDALPRIFTFGFTTRQDGHGFGLHSSANLAQEMGGAIRAASEGEGRGATFTLDLPLNPERVLS